MTPQSWSVVAPGCGLQRSAAGATNAASLTSADDGAAATVSSGGEAEVGRALRLDLVASCSPAHTARRTPTISSAPPME